MNVPFAIHCGDSTEVLRQLPDCSIDAVVSDPPYGLSGEPDPVKVMTAWVKGETYHHKASGFMGLKWDAFVPQPAAFKEVLRVLKPGGYGLIFAGSRTQDWMTMSLRFAGFEIVDTLMWVHAQGMPKSHNISKAIMKSGGTPEQGDLWDGWGTQLKPAYEPILLVRRPLDKTFAQNVLTHGVGGLNIDACRIHADDATGGSYVTRRHATGNQIDKTGNWKSDQPFRGEMKAGRWPANLLHDDSEAVLALFPESAGQHSAVTGDEVAARGYTGSVRFSGKLGGAPARFPRSDTGSAARFFFCSKPSKAERHRGTKYNGQAFCQHGSTPRQVEDALIERGEGNWHPTLKPVALIKWLCQLITPPGGVLLDMYCGSGTTGVAAIELGFSFIGADSDKKHAKVAKMRCEHALQAANMDCR